VNQFIETPNNMALSVDGARSASAAERARGLLQHRDLIRLADDIDLNPRAPPSHAFGATVLRSQDNLDSGFNQNGVFAFNG